MGSSHFPPVKRTHWRPSWPAPWPVCQDPKLQELLNSEGLSFEDVRATYIIAMTGPNTAMLECLGDDPL